MKRDYDFFHRRFIRIEDDFLEILDFIDISDDFNDPCYKVGSPKLMDFCLKVGTEVETLFRQILESSRFDSLPNILKKRSKQNIHVHKEVIEPVYNLSEYRLLVNLIDIEITPFENFDTQTPEWFKIYSPGKHNKTELLGKWNIRHSIYSLGCLLILVINHPCLDDKEFRIHRVSQRVFDLLDSRPKFGGVNISINF